VSIAIQVGQSSTVSPATLSGTSSTVARGTHVAPATACLSQSNLVVSTHVPQFASSSPPPAPS
jgi:hypothetical protein